MPCADHFCVVDLGRKVDASRSIAVIANGMVAVRMREGGSCSDHTRQESAGLTATERLRLSKI